MLLTYVPSILNGNDASLIFSNLKKSWLGEIKMLPGRIAPASVITWLIEIWWAKVGGRNKQRWLSGLAPLRIVHTFNFVTSTACLAVVEHSLA